MAYYNKSRVLKSLLSFIEKDVMEDSTCTDISDDMPGTSSTVEVEIHNRL